MHNVKPKHVALRPLSLNSNAQKSNATKLLKLRYMNDNMSKNRECWFSNNFSSFLGSERIFCAQSILSMDVIVCFSRRSIPLVVFVAWLSEKVMFCPYSRILNNLSCMVNFTFITMILLKDLRSSSLFILWTSTHYCAFSLH